MSKTACWEEFSFTGFAKISKGFMFCGRLAQSFSQMSMAGIGDDDVVRIYNMSKYIIKPFGGSRLFLFMTRVPIYTKERGHLRSVRKVT